MQVSTSPVALNSTTDFPKLDDLNRVLHYVLPCVSGLTMPISIVNIVVMLNLGVLRSPSTIIYFTLILMDILNALTGFLITADPESKHWKGVESNIYLFTFDATIVLIFGLAVVRLVFIKMSALRVLANLRKLAYSAALASVLFGVFAVYYPHILHRLGYTKSFVNFAWLDLLELLFVFCTVVMSLYTWSVVRGSRSLIHSPVFKRANTTSLCITLNFIASYTYYTFLNSARMYYTLHQRDCPPRSWMMVLVCRDSLYIGVTAMCVHSLNNNIILMSQCHVREFIWSHLVYFSRDLKRKCSCNQTNESYRYFEDYA